MVKATDVPIILIAPVAPIVPTLPLTIEAHFNAAYLAIIESPEPSLLDKIELIKTALDQTHLNLTALIIKKTKDRALQTQLSHVDAVLTAIDANEKNTPNKLYALDLINSIRGSVDTLIEQATEKKEKELAARLREQIEQFEQQIEDPELVRTVIDGVEFAASSILSIPKSYFRHYVPGFVQNIVHSQIKKRTPALFDTLDSQCKETLKALAQSRHASLSGHVNEAGTLTTKGKITLSDDSIVRSIARVASGNTALIPLISASPINQLEQLLIKNRDVHRVMMEYAELSTQMMNNQAQLLEANKLDINVNAFLLEHDGFLVTLSLFLSKICSLFKTDTAKKVEGVRTVKTDLKALKLEYQAALEQGKAEILANNNTSPVISAAFIAKLTVSPDPAPEAIQPNNIITQFDLIQTMFNGLAPAARRAAINPVLVVADTNVLAPA